jgi:hypothetical protein
MRTLQIAILLLASMALGAQELPGLRVSENGRFFRTVKGEPFFWLGDTGWLLLTRLTRELTDQYLEDRSKKGFNVVQVMVVHGLTDTNVYGDSALAGKNLATPKPGGYWDQVDYVVDKAAEKGIYVALVPVWGGVVKAGKITPAQGKAYAAFLASRYKNKTNIIWMNGGDIKGSDYQETWNAIGAELRAQDRGHLITFHPRGRASSSFWFQQQGWLDFNSIQSGHKSYEQDTAADDPNYGEDNWRYIRVDYQKKPVKPVLDAEPSYEGIPHGLHDTLAPRWGADDVRRYGYWSVFAGACGYTYGNNSVMQLLRPTDKGSAYGAKAPWFEAINDQGAGQMVYLKKLLLSRPYFERVPDESLVENQGEKYDYAAATRGKQYAFIYTYTGRRLKVKAARLRLPQVEASWYNPRDGSWVSIGIFPGNKVLSFDPPGRPAPGNDWVLVLDKPSKNAYLFTSFREPATDGLYFLSSTDGKHWTDLGGSWLKPEIGEKKLMRDPSMAVGPDGTWHLVWTCGWDGDKGFGYASSKDLIHWSKQQFVPVMAREADAFNVWAPEIFYEKDSAQYLIVWATTIPFRFPKGMEEEKNNHRLYCTTTKDFKKFAPTRLFFDPGYSVIDAMIVQRGARDFVLVFKDNTRLQRNIKVAFSDRASGPYHDDSKAFTPEFTEGPSVAATSEGYYIYFDSYREKKYGAVKTTDFKTFSDASAEVDVPVGHKHGTIVVVDRETLTRLKKSKHEHTP